MVLKFVDAVVEGYMAAFNTLVCVVPPRVSLYSFPPRNEGLWRICIPILETCRGLEVD